MFLNDNQKSSILLLNLLPLFRSPSSSSSVPQSSSLAWKALHNSKQHFAQLISFIFYFTELNNLDYCCTSNIYVIVLHTLGCCVFVIEGWEGKSSLNSHKYRLHKIAPKCRPFSYCALSTAFSTDIWMKAMLKTQIWIIHLWKKQMNTDFSFSSKEWGDSVWMCLPNKFFLQ